MHREEQADTINGRALFVTRSRQVPGRVVDPETAQHEVEAISGIGEVKIPQFFLMDRKK